MNKTSDTTAADLPPAPNGHGAENGTKTDETQRADTTTDDSIKEAPSSKKNKRKAQRHDRQHASAQSVSTAGPATTGRTEPTPDDPQPPLIEELAAAAPIGQPPEDPAEPIIEQPAANLRLRMKVWSDPTTAKRYLMPSAFMRDVVNGHPVSDVMYAYAMRDDSTKIVTLTAAEWNALPFFYFQEDGPAPRAASRPLDDVAVSHTKTS